ncbi:Mce protein [Mycobacterium lentiflavum]|uniref:Mce protein n=1 Tax=Mycobacterium lentiflavum TaxID=141349 RepID=A0ABY3UVX8_MYCLN|nr:Mce protein [Mycobacterium lentiflavum]ULP42804.1 Mce protein [Mycobacterium lentiflavum]
MEGDAGTSRLNPPPMSMLSRLRRRRPKKSDDVTDETNTEVTAEDSPESEVGAEQTDPEVTAEDSPESEVGAEQTDPEVTAEDSPAEAPEPPESATDAAPAADDAEQPEADGEQTDTDAAPEADAERRPPSALGRGWLAGIAATLIVLAGAVGTGGYLAMRYHHESQAIARNNAAALKAAIECVSATQAPDTNAMIASEQKIIECGTDAFREQAMVYTGMLVQAYQSANIHVQVSDVRGAVERNNKDGSIDVLVAMRVQVVADQSQNETGYRLRVRMALDEGQYRIARLDQVTK